MSGRLTPCRKRCCWTPYGVCAKAGNCSCHAETLRASEDLRAEIISLAERETERARRRQRRGQGA